MRRLVPFVLSFAFWVPAAHAWTWPVPGSVLQGYAFDRSHPYDGGQHRGIDVGAASGSPVRAPASGTVSFAGTVAANGLTVTIETADGLAVSLTHLGSLAVSKGADVIEGDAIGTVGSSGTPEVDGPYVHLGIRAASDPNGYVDPLSLLPVASAPPPPQEPAQDAAASTPPDETAPSTEQPAAATPSAQPPSSGATRPDASAPPAQPSASAAPAADAGPVADQGTHEARAAPASERPEAAPTPLPVDPSAAAPTAEQPAEMHPEPLPEARPAPAAAPDVAPAPVALPSPGATAPLPLRPARRRVRSGPPVVQPVHVARRSTPAVASRVDRSPSSPAIGAEAAPAAPAAPTRVAGTPVAHRAYLRPAVSAAAAPRDRSGADEPALGSSRPRRIPWLIVGLVGMALSLGLAVTIVVVRVRRRPAPADEGAVVMHLVRRTAEEGQHERIAA